MTATRNPDDLLKQVQKVAPQVADSHEIAALVESFGNTDRSMKDWGFPDVFSLAEHLFIRFPRNYVPPRDETNESKGRELMAELWRAVCKICPSLAYAVPWMALLALQYLYPDALQVSPELGGALSLSLIASLITTGGFTQMISRSGNFYYGLQEPFLARQFCISLLVLGTMSVVALSLLGILIGLYFQIFAGTYLLLAAVNYLGLCLLWMFCAVMSVQGTGWCIPLVFLVSGLLATAVRMVAHPSTTALLMLWPPLALLCALPCILWGFRYLEKKHPNARDSARPRFSVAMISMVPFFLYGTVYFSFMFADRLTAGSAIPWVSGLSFGIDSAYTQGMDLVLLAFLVTAASTEYFSDAFLRFWMRLAKELPQAQNDRLVARLQQRHATIIFAIFIVFLVICAVSWQIFSGAFGIAPSQRLVQTALMGGLGYLMLSIALLENIILASINATPWALRSVAIGLGVNLLAGYALSHWLGVQYAAMGLLLGAAVLLWKCNGAVRQALRHPDYHYSIA